MNYRHLTETARYQIQTLSREGVSMRGIGKRLGYSTSTISREMRRNGDSNGYYAQAAERRARQRCQQASSRPRIPATTWAVVAQCLREDHSPEQITGRLRKLGQPSVSHERIYQYIMADQKAGGDLWKHRRHGRPRKRRMPRRATRFRDGRPLSQRSACAAGRTTLGHWEGDTMLGRTRTRLLTLVERKTRFCVIRRSRDGCAKTVLAQTLRGLHPWQDAVAGCVKSIAWDNGSEFAEHAVLDLALGCTSYFARPYASWERGTNENCNGLIRQYAPKRSDLGKLNDAAVLKIADTLNDRPRKVLGFCTPREALEASLAGLKKRSEYKRKQQAKALRVAKAELYTIYPVALQS
ncbi:MAG TPA: IS30 family transposase [Rudaea sp.]|nr:IS30 family transposase [Rudaea sp.]